MKNTWLDSIRTKLAQRKFEATDADWDSMERLLDTHLPANADDATKSSFFIVLQHSAGSSLEPLPSVMQQATHPASSYMKISCFSAAERSKPTNK